MKSNLVFRFGGESLLISDKMSSELQRNGVFFHFPSETPDPESAYCQIYQLLPYKPPFLCPYGVPFHSSMLITLIKYLLMQAFCARIMKAEVQYNIFQPVYPNEIFTCCKPAVGRRCCGFLCARAPGLWRGEASLKQWKGRKGQGGGRCK